MEIGPVSGERFGSETIVVFGTNRAQGKGPARGAETQPGSGGLREAEPCGVTEDRGPECPCEPRGASRDVEFSDPASLVLRQPPCPTLGRGEDVIESIKDDDRAGDSAAAELELEGDEFLCADIAKLSEI